jgi:hypothetical protein
MAENRLDLEALAEEYKAGRSIRQLAAEHYASYGSVRTALIGAGVTLRGRGSRPIVVRVRSSARAIS